MRDSTAKNVKFHTDLHRRVTAGILHAGKPSGAQFVPLILSHLQPSVYLGGTDRGQLDSDPHYDPH
jgi:hypothetical protein